MNLEELDKLIAQRSERLDNKKEEGKESFADEVEREKKKAEEAPKVPEGNGGEVEEKIKQQAQQLIMNLQQLSGMQPASQEEAANIQYEAECIQMELQALEQQLQQLEQSNGRTEE